MKTKTKKLAPNKLPFGVGDSILIRTVTHYQVGRVAAILPGEIVLTDASWVADTGRFSAAVSMGRLSEIERVLTANGISWIVVGRGAIVDVVPWEHPLPTETK